MNNSNSQNIVRIITYRGVTRVVADLRKINSSAFSTSCLANIFRVIEPVRLPSLANEYRYSRSNRSG